MTTDDSFDKMVQELQQKIYEDEEKTYSKKVIREYRNPTHFGFVEHPDASSRVKGSCGDTMKIDLTMGNNIVQNARFWTDGCGASIACGNMLMKMIQGKSTAFAAAITDTELIAMLDGLPQEHVHCAALAVNTLHKAVKDYLSPLE